MLSFESLGLNAPLLEAVRDLGYENPTPIQAEVIPMLLESETDLVALAQTGTGKTAAFGLPLLQKTEVDQRKTQGVILSLSLIHISEPTRPAPLSRMPSSA